MPIKVACACGAAFAAKDELAGRTVKCPKCQRPLKIPAGGAPPAAKAASAPAPQKRAPQHQQPPQPAAAANVASAFDDIGLGQQAAGTRQCPGCSAPMAANAIICIKCGYNAKLGRRMGTVSSGGGGGGGHGGHGDASADILNRAAQVLDEDKAEEAKKTGEGAPWWVYLLAMGGVVGFIAMMMILPPKVALMTGGVVFYLVAACVGIYGTVRILIIAFTEGVIHGVGCLLCGIYYIYYCVTRWELCGSYFMLVLAANVVGNILGVAFQMLASQFGNGEESRMPPPIVAPAEVTWHHPGLLRIPDNTTLTRHVSEA